LTEPLPTRRDAFGGVEGGAEPTLARASVLYTGTPFVNAVEGGAVTPRRRAGRAGQCAAGRVGECWLCFGLESTGKVLGGTVDANLAQECQGEHSLPSATATGFEGAESLASRDVQHRVCCMWTPPVGQAWIQNRVGGSGPGTVVCPASRCSAVRLRARMVFVDRIQIGLAGSEAHQHTLVFPIPSCRPFALTRSCVLLPTHPRQLLCFSLLSSLRPVRRRCEPGRSPSSLSAPKPSAPSCWREPPPPASSACVPTSRPATDPCSGRTGPRAQQRPWLP